MKKRRLGPDSMREMELTEDTSSNKDNFFSKSKLPKDEPNFATGQRISDRKPNGCTEQNP